MKRACKSVLREAKQCTHFNTNLERASKCPQLSQYRFTVHSPERLERQAYESTSKDINFSPLDCLIDHLQGKDHCTGSGKFSYEFQRSKQSAPSVEYLRTKRRGIFHPSIIDTVIPEETYKKTEQERL